MQSRSDAGRGTGASSRTSASITFSEFSRLGDPASSHATTSSTPSQASTPSLAFSLPTPRPFSDSKVTILM